MPSLFNRASGATKTKEVSLTPSMIPLMGAKTLKGEISQTVYHHSIATFYAANYIYEQLPPKIKAKFSKTLLLFLMVLHDSGKLSPGFQLKLYKDLVVELKETYNSNHAIVGAIFAEHYCKHNMGLSDRASKDVRNIIGAHHGAIEVNGSKANDKALGGDAWHDLRCEFADRMLSEIDGFDISVLSEFENLDFVTKKMIAGLVVQCDWMGSGVSECLLGCTNEDINAKVRRHIRSIEEKGLELKNVIFEDLFFNEDGSFSPNELQKAIEGLDMNNNVFCIESGMGSGKTEASLYLVYRAMRRDPYLGLFYSLPTILTSNEAHKRVQKFFNALFGETDLHLIHGKASFMDVCENSSDQYRWYSSNNRAKLLSKYGVGTLDQALLSVINAYHPNIRSYALANKIVVIDEVHSYDDFMLELVRRLIDDVTRLNGKVILLSATLPDKTKEKLFGKREFSSHYPLITELSLNKDRDSFKEHPIKSKEPSKKYNLNLITTYGSDVNVDTVVNGYSGGKKLVIKNTVGSSQRFYEKLCGSGSGIDAEIGLVHSAFINVDRAEKEKYWVERYSKKSSAGNYILVGTQILEQSLDIDGFSLDTDLAPLETLLQRTGRVDRHSQYGLNVERNINISAPDLNYHINKADAKLKDLRRLINGNIYNPYYVLMSYLYLKSKSYIVLPDDFRPMINWIYIQDIDSMDISDKWKAVLEEAKIDSEKTYKKLMGKSGESITNDFRPMDIGDYASTRYITQDTHNLLCCRSIKNEGGIDIITFLDGSSLTSRPKDNINLTEMRRKFHENSMSTWLPEGKNGIKKESLMKIEDSRFKNFCNDGFILEISPQGAVSSGDYQTGMSYNKRIGLKR